MTLILVEALVIGLVAGALGIGLAAIVVGVIPKLPGAGALSFFGITRLAISPFVAGLTFGIALALGLVAGFMPAYGSYRARITDMLRAA
jgi:ABC-type antimicrobial peptide transport system permease subunit